MWQTNWRDNVWSQLDQPWDIIVVGGGITGAGILRAATHVGLRALLVEKNDFAWGTSSRSTKLVHGGLRYLRQGQFGVTRESVRERDRLVKEAPGLIESVGFLVPTYKGDSPSKRSLAAGLAVYDWFARKWDHRYYRGDDFLVLAPHIRTERLTGGFRYYDSIADDARLVLRVIREAVLAGATALNYATAESLLFAADGRVNGVSLRDGLTRRTAELRARAVVNATGAWADRLRSQVGGEARIRPSRGSHLIFPAWRLPIAQAVTLVHPQDGRPVFVLPWEGVTVAGTTDLDHGQHLDDDPQMTSEEVNYLMAALDARFPSLSLDAADAVASFAGVRPLVGSSKGDPSKVSRAHAVWEENGLLTITGGKLTTFRLMALDTLKAARHLLPDLPPVNSDIRMLDPIVTDLPGTASLDGRTEHRVLGRYGAEAPAVIASAGPGELEPVPETNSLWVELRWGARSEGVVHLDDLLLRRVHIGLLLPQGAMPIIEEIRSVVQPELGWDDAHWEAEVAAYTETWKRGYSVPGECCDSPPTRGGRILEGDGHPRSSSPGEDE
jgi:glycerol-3-phosphate dehydrogenase